MSFNSAGLGTQCYNRWKVIITEDLQSTAHVVARYIKIFRFSLVQKKCSIPADACVMHRHDVIHLSNMRHVYVMFASNLRHPLHLAAGLDLNNSQYRFQPFSR